MKGGYAEEFAKCRPGLLSNFEVVAICFKRRRRTFELLGNVEPWKEMWSTGVHERTTLLAFAPTLRGRLEHAAFAYGRPAAIKARDIARAALNAWPSGSSAGRAIERPRRT